MSGQTPLFERSGESGGAATGRTTANVTATGGPHSAGSPGPTVTLSTSSGSTYTVDGEDLLVYAALLQTALLIIMLYREVNT